MLASVGGGPASPVVGPVVEADPTSAEAADRNAEESDVEGDGWGLAAAPDREVEVV